MINILLCGGLGTRLWPLSRTKMPKQFVRLFAGRSLFQKTLERNAPLCEQTLVVTNSEQYFLARNQVQEVNRNHTNLRFLLEPAGRNTAPAIALACMLLPPEEIVLVTPSDHLIQDQAAYARAVQLAQTAAEKEDALITFGIKPDDAETGFGYIEALLSNQSVQQVVSFHEKPDQAKAEHYLTQTNFYWNSGMFCFKAGVFLRELEQYSHAIYTKCINALEGLDIDAAILKIEPGKMQAIPENSIDYAVMEPSKRVKVVPCALGWSDLGSFDALYQEMKTPEEPNAVLLQGVGAKEPIVSDSKKNLVVASNKQMALVDVENLLIVDTDDAILISQRGSAQKVKQIVATLKQSVPELTEVHRLAYRPWGTYEVLIDTIGYKVKRIMVQPGGRLSLQKHLHRNEHWIVVSGTATVTVDQKTRLVRPNESTYIKMGQLHRLENHGKIDLVMIEVQVGEYTGEDDIERIEDMYARS